MSIQIHKACRTNDVETVKNFFNSETAKDLTDSSFNSLLITASKAGHLEIVKTIIELSNNPKSPLSLEEVDMIIHAAYTSKNLDLLDYILKDSKLIDSKDNEIIGKLGHHASINKGVKVIEYLLDEFPDNQYLLKRIKNGDMLRNCSIVGDVNIIKLLFSRENLKEYLDLHMDDDACFEYANRSKHFHILNYFIFDLNIELTSNIKSYIEIDSEAMKMFKARDLKKSLQKDLSDNNTTSKKIKI